MNFAIALTLTLITSDLASRRDGVVQEVEKVSPAVVYIGTVQVIERRFRSQSPLDDFFYGPQNR